MIFDERVLIQALIRRNADAKRFSLLFDPSWLDTVELRPILKEVYDFTKEKGVAPSIDTIRTRLKRRDEAAYNNRYSKALDKLESDGVPDDSLQIETLDMAKNVAISRSLRNMFSSATFNTMNKEFDGQSQLKQISNWLHKFTGDYERDQIHTLKEAIDELRTSEGVDSEIRLSCGIKPIDKWCGGGLYTKQLAIIAAPSGHGKSICLELIAHHIAAVERQNVLFITNELTERETAIRLLAKMTGNSMNSITHDQHNPYHYKGLKRLWTLGLDKRIMIWECLRDISCDDIEAVLTNVRLIHGWQPHALVVDFMERMRPNTLMGLQRSDTSNWFGAVARDLVMVAKRNNALVWTAAQVNRSGLRSNAMGGDHLQGSIKHLQEATALFMLRKIYASQSEKDVYFQFIEEKMRHAKNTGRKCVVAVDLDKMHIGEDHIKLDEEETELEGQTRNWKEYTEEGQKKRKKRRGKDSA